MEKRDEIKTMYEMVYPYGDYNYDVPTSCIAINRELRKLCNDQFRHILLILARYLKIKFTPNTPTLEICGNIQSKLYDICQSSELDKSKFLIGLKTGIIDIENEDLINCKYFTKKFKEFGIGTIYDLFYKSENILDILDNERSNVKYYYWIHRKEILNNKKYKKQLNKLERGDYTELLKEFKNSKEYSKLFTEDYYRNKIYNPYDETEREWNPWNPDEDEILIKNESQLKTLIKILNLALEGKISPFDEFESICSKF